MTTRREAATPQERRHVATGSLLGLLPLVAVVVATGPLWLWGLPAGHDWGWELVRIVEYREALATGQLPPFWAVDLYSGWGSPIFLFYAPLFAALASVGSILSGSLLSGTSVVLVLLSIISAYLVMLTMRALPEQEGNTDRRGATRVAAYLYVLHPYLLVDLLVRNANAEYTALCLLPLVLLGIFQLRRRPLLGGLALALGLGLGILAHNLTALVAMGLAVFVLVVLYLPKPSRARLRPAVSGTVLGLLLSAWFWVPALMLTGQIRADSLVEGRYDFHQNFLTLRDFWGFSEYFSAGLLGPLVLLVAATVAGSSRLRLSEWTRRLFWVFLVCAFGMVLLQLRVSRPLWEAVPLLPLFQFPWRWMGPLALLTAILGGLLFLGFTSRVERRTVLWLELLVLLACIANAWPRLTRVEMFSPEGRAAIENGLTPEAIRQGRQSATGMNEYLPANADLEAWKEAPPQSLLLAPATGIEVIEVEQSGTRLRLVVEAATATRLRLARWYFPEWRATLRGQPATVEPGPAGEVTLQVPTGRSDLELVLVPPLARRVCLWISAAAVVVFLIAFGLQVSPWRGRYSSS